MLKFIGDFKASYPYPLEYPIKLVVTKFGLKGFVAWVYQRFASPVEESYLVVNERILEIPIAHQWLGQCFDNESGIKILEIGHVASSFSLELANIGYHVTAIDLRTYPFIHFNLTSLRGDFLTHNFNQRFDAILALSVIEHFGFSKRYGGEDEKENNNDQLAFSKISDLLSAEGRAIISVPFARQVVSGVWYRVYIRRDIEEKLGRYFNIEKKKYYFRKDNQWSEASESDDPSLPYDGVAMFLLGKK